MSTLYWDTAIGIQDTGALPSRHPLTVVGMTTTSGELTSPADDHDLVLRLAATAYLGRYTGTSRIHTESDLRLFFAWSADQYLAPLTVQRAQIERYVRWMQEIRRFKPSTVSRRMAVSCRWSGVRHGCCP